MITKQQAIDFCKSKGHEIFHETDTATIFKVKDRTWGNGIIITDRDITTHCSVRFLKKDGSLKITDENFWNCTRLDNAIIVDGELYGRESL